MTRGGNSVSTMTSMSKSSLDALQLRAIADLLKSERVIGVDNVQHYAIPLGERSPIPCV